MLSTSYKQNNLILDGIEQFWSTVEISLFTSLMLPNPTQLLIAKARLMLKYFATTFRRVRWYFGWKTISLQEHISAGMHLCKSCTQTALLMIYNVLMLTLLRVGQMRGNVTFCFESICFISNVGDAILSFKGFIIFLLCLDVFISVRIYYDWSIEIVIQHTSHYPCPRNNGKSVGFFRLNDEV